MMFGECVCGNSGAHLPWIWSFFYFLAGSRQNLSPCFPFYDLFWLNILSFGLFSWAEWTYLFFLHLGI